MSNKIKNKMLKDLSGAAVTEAEYKKLKNEIDSTDTVLKNLESKTKDPYTSRNEFKPGFYNQKDKPATSYETMKGVGAKTAPNVTDTESFMEGGFARGQKAIQVKKVPFRGVF
jgi:flagellar motility protein MotE (MotC chaperone)